MYYNFYKFIQFRTVITMWAFNVFHIPFINELITSSYYSNQIFKIVLNKK